MTFQIALGYFTFFPSFFLYLTPSLYRALSLSHFPVQITCTLRISFILFPNPPILTMFFISWFPWLFQAMFSYQKMCT